MAGLPPPSSAGAEKAPLGEALATDHPCVSGTAYPAVDTVWKTSSARDFGSGSSEPLVQRFNVFVRFDPPAASDRTTLVRVIDRSCELPIIKGCRRMLETASA